MHVHGFMVALKCAVLVACASILIACGGGGAGGNTTGGASNGGSFSATFQPASINADLIGGNGSPATFSALLHVVGSESDVIVVAEGDSSIIGSFDGNLVNDTLSGQITFLTDLPNGAYDTRILLHACLDIDCKRELSGSPVSLPIHYVVKPNIDVQQQVTLSRTGADAAPAITLPVTAPAEAGTVSLLSFGQSNIVNARLDGSSLSITTTQERAGQYSAQIVLQGSSDARYRRAISVDYTVLPPSTGEAPMSATPGNVGRFLQQSTAIATESITITPPTWTDSPITAELVDINGMMALNRVPGTNQYNLAINPATRPLGNYDAFIRFTAGPTGGTLVVPIQISVGESFFPQFRFDVELNAASTLADLQLVTPILTADGSSALWTASTSTSWLSLDPLSGATATATPLTLRIDPAVAATSDLAHFGSYTVATNQPGTVSQDFDVRFSNHLPWLQRTSAVLTGTSGRIYVEGTYASSRVIETGSVKATGATLVATNYRRDNRFAGDFIVLAIDVTDAKPGSPITISGNTPLFSSQVNLAVQVPARVAPSYQSLPLAAYRPASFAPGLGAFYFSSPGKVLRWSVADIGTPLLQVDIAGVIGIALRPDEQRLHAASGAAMLALNPNNLAVLATSPALGDIFGQHPDPAWQFDGSGTAYLPSLTHASDGRALASVATAGAPAFATRSPYWITSPTPTRALGDLTDAPMLGDPGANPLVTHGSLTGSSLVASPSLHAVVASNPDGNVAMYLSELAGWRAGPNVGIGNAVVASADDGQTLVTSNGSVYSAGSSVGNLKSLLQQTEFAGGFGVTQDGRHALVYTYQINATQGLASNALLRVVDLDQALLTSFSPASVVSTIALDAPVGCTTLPLAAGETCLHSASITLTPGSSSVFILGPRAVAAVALPVGISVQSATATKRKRLDTKARNLPLRTPLKRPLGAIPARP